MLSVGEVISAGRQCHNKDNRYMEAGLVKEEVNIMCCLNEAVILNYEFSSNYQECICHSILHF